MTRERVSDKVFGLDAVEIYKLVLKGDLKIFPKGFWQLPEAPENAIKVTKYLFEDVLKWTRDDICKKLNRNTYFDNKLNGMFKAVYDSFVFKAFDAAYPGQYKEWEFNCVSMTFWTEENALNAMRWLIEEKLKWCRQDIIENLETRVFRDNGLRHIYDTYFKSSPYNLLDKLYPSKFKPWEIKHTRKGFWTKETAIEATKWLVEEKLKLDIEVIKDINVEIFVKHGLATPLERYYHYNTKKALITAYPDRFKQEAKK